MTDNFYVNNDVRLNEANNLLNQMSVEELTRLLNNNQEMNKFIQQLSEIQQLEGIKESVRDSNKRLASKNLESEPRLRLEKEKLAELHAELARLRDQYQSIRGQYDDQNGDMNPDMIHTLLQSAASALDRSTEQQAEDFFYGEKSEDEVTDFERRFIENRRRVHELKIKAEKFHELMQASQATAYLNPNNRHSGYR